jgi:photosystem II stability/assembly factor-like uncharacterized protein/dienelactone hydrolase
MKYFITCLFALGTFWLASQELPRKAYFGAQLESQENGVILSKVLGGTALQLNLQQGDLIQEINGVKITTSTDLISELKKYSAGDNIRLVILRKKKRKMLTGIFAGRPFENSSFSEVIYDAATYKNGLLRVIINKPLQSGKMPGLLFIPGYTCSSIDNLSDNHPYKRIIDAYVKAGFVSLRIEKSGLGDSKNTPACESCDLMDEIENFQVGLNKLKSLPYVDTNNIVIFGHSMGGVIAPALSAKNKVSGVVVYGTTAKSWFEYQLEVARVQNLLAEMDPLEYEKSITNQYELNYRFFVKKESLHEIAKDSVSLKSLIENFQYDSQTGKIFDRNPEYWRQIQDVSHLENWKNTSGKVLVQFGESDFQAFSRADHEQIVRTVNYYKPNYASLQVFPLTDHYFAKSGTMKDAYDKFANQQYAQLFEEYNHEVGKSAVDWSLNLISSPTSKQKEQIWKKLETEKYPGKQDDICFINDTTAWYVNGYGKIFRTDDGGKTWSKIFEKQGSFFRCITFLTDKIGFVGTVGTDYFPNVSDTIPLYKTRDGGYTWEAVNYEGPYVKGLCAIDVVKEPFINHGVIDHKIHIYAVGRVGSPANCMISHDGGETWLSQSMNDDAKMLFDIKMFDKNTGIACAATHEDISLSNALLLKTVDGGKTWKKVYQSNRPYETTWKVSFPSPLVGYATVQSYNPDPSVNQQRILKTTNGGETWIEINLIEDHGARQFGIGFVDENHGFVGTLKTGYETKDGGKTWKAIDLGKACNKIRIQQTGNTFIGYAIGLDVFKWTVE